MTIIMTLSLITDVKVQKIKYYENYFHLINRISFHDFQNNIIMQNNFIFNIFMTNDKIDQESQNSEKYKFLNTNNNLCILIMKRYIINILQVYDLI